MKRRDLLTGLACATFAGTPESAIAEPAAETIYIPQPQRVEDRRFLHDFMDEFPFVDLVTVSPSLHITHIPVFLDRDAGAFGTIHGHISRQNSQRVALEDRQTAVVVFHGPHGYISPTWYAKAGNVVPTWNFAVVHATGKLRPVEAKEALESLLSKLIAKFERYEGTGYDFSKVDPTYKYGLMGGIIGFELEIDLLEGKFKLGQDRNPDDRESLIRNLQRSKEPPSLRDFTASFYAWQKKA
jgi:transcriptional regulator